MRVALYWTPAQGDALAASGNAWLGRDPEAGTAVPQPPLPGIAEITAAPRLYGFHATLRPPMRLATDWQDFLAAADRLAADTAPFVMPRFAVRDMTGFLALELTAPCPFLPNFADACVRVTDPHRLRPDDAELARRRAHPLSAEQDALLLRWGYPYVMRHWRFHMTLTRQLDEAEMGRLNPAAASHFHVSLGRPQTFADLTVFTQRKDGAPFLVAERLRLRG